MTTLGRSPPKDTTGPPLIEVHLLPDGLRPEELNGAVAVLIDVLRASTTIVRALAAGAERVIPCREVEEARQIAGRFAPGQVRLGGERKSVKIPGFDLGNSPAEYTTEVCRGQTLVFTTTNGTKALERLRSAEHVIIGAFVNRHAVSRALCRLAAPVHLVCSGTDGEVTLEDVLLAGAIIDRLQAEGGPRRLTDTARIAWGAYCAFQDRLLDAIRTSRGAEKLTRAGLENDIVDAVQLDTVELVPIVERDSWQIVTMKPP